MDGFVDVLETEKSKPHRHLSTKTLACQTKVFKISLMRQTIFKLMMVGVLVFVSACSPDSKQTDQSTKARKEKIQAQERIKPSAEAQDRKDRSEAILREEGVPINPYLPVIGDSKVAKRRMKEEVAKRAIAIILTAVKAEGLDQTNVDRLVDDYGAASFFSPEEESFMKKATPSQKDRIKFTWRHEDYWVLLWALGYVDDLGRPEQQCDVEKTAKFLSHTTTEDFIKNAKLRNTAEILDKADLIYRYHWAAVDARIHEKSSPAKLNEEVLFEWHYVLNWLIGYMDQNWDSVTTDI